MVSIFLPEKSKKMHKLPPFGTVSYTHLTLPTN